MVWTSALDERVFEKTLDKLIFAKEADNEELGFLWKILDVLVDKVFEILDEFNEKLCLLFWLRDHLLL